MHTYVRAYVRMCACVFGCVWVCVGVWVCLGVWVYACVYVNSNVYFQSVLFGLMEYPCTGDIRTYVRTHMSVDDVMCVLKYHYCFLSVCLCSCIVVWSQIAH